MAYLSLKPYKPKSEKELHSLIEHHLETLNLQLIKYEFKYEKKNPDFLCVDEDGKLTVIEVKLGIDKNIIFQAMSYYKMVDKYKNLIAKEVPEVKPNEGVHLILIAKDYTTDTINVLESLKIDINTYTYQSVIDKETNKPGIILDEILFTTPEIFQPVEFPKIEDHLNRFSDEKLKEIYIKIAAEITDLRVGIEIFVVKNYIGFKYKGRNIATIHIRKTYFWLVSFKYDENDKYIENIGAKVITGKEEEINEVNENIKKLIKIIK